MAGGSRLSSLTLLLLTHLPYDGAPSFRPQQSGPTESGWDDPAEKRKMAFRGRRTPRHRPQNGAGSQSLDCFPWACAREGELAP